MFSALFEWQSLARSPLAGSRREPRRQSFANCGPVPTRPGYTITPGRLLNSLPGGSPSLPPDSRIFFYTIVEMPTTIANPYGTIWGIRIHDVTDEKDALLRDISGIIVVAHMRGKTSSRPHYHIYYESHELKKDSLKAALKADEKWSTLLKDPKKYTFTTKPEYSLDSYWSYVWSKNKDQRLVCWNHAVTQYDIPARIEHVPTIELVPGTTVVTDVSAVKPKAKTSEEKMQQFARYAYECYKDDTHTILDEDFVIDCLIEYSKGGFNDNAAGMYVRYAVWYICEQEGDELARKKQFMKAAWRERVKKRFF